MTSRQSILMHRTMAKPFPTFREDLDEPGTQRQISMDYADYCDMGRPAVITVTIEPGDTLNDEPS